MAPSATLAQLVPPGSVYAPMRITGPAKMTHLIQFALKHFQTSENASVLLHSLPAPTLPDPLDGPSTSTPAVLDMPPPPVPSADVAAITPKPSTSSGLSKLVSIAEIIKRTYATAARERTAAAVVESLEQNRSRKGKGKVEGLHQYTKLGSLEEIGLAGEPEEHDGLDLDVDEETRREKVALDHLTSGAARSTRPRRHHSPYMLVMLSAVPVDSLDRDPTWTHQPPLAPSAPKLVVTPRREKRSATGDPAAAPAPELPTKRRKRKRQRSKHGATPEPAEVFLPSLGGPEAMEISAGGA